MGLASPLRRLPLSSALRSLRQSEAAHKLSPAVSGIAINFRPGAKEKDDRGALTFIHRTAPRIAYANPTLPFLVSRIPVPFSPSKSAYKQNQDPNPPANEEEKARFEAAALVKPTVTISFHSREPATFELSGKSASQIWAYIDSLAGPNAQKGVTTPTEETKA